MSNAIADYIANNRSTSNNYSPNARTAVVHTISFPDDRADYTVRDAYMGSVSDIIRDHENVFTARRRNRAIASCGWKFEGHVFSCTYKDGRVETFSFEAI